MQFYFAPVQGHTDAAYRHFHSHWYGNNQTYVTPFIRLEKDNLRTRDLKDYNSNLNNNTELIPQIIFRDLYELSLLVKIFKENGATKIDLNMGCPFPLQTGHGRGAATIDNLSLHDEIVKIIKENPEISFSVKMRLGLKEPDEWHHLLNRLNLVHLSHIVLHPRVARQQYAGTPNLEAFQNFLHKSINPVIYNGDIKTPEDIFIIKDKFPEIKGIMIGRGLLGRPSIIQEYKDGKEYSIKERQIKMLGFHNDLFKHYSNVLCGDSQIISKIQPFWEYAEEEIGRRAWKAIKKATSIPKYQTAVAIIQNSIT